LTLKEKMKKSGMPGRKKSLGEKKNNVISAAIPSQSGENASPQRGLKKKPGKPRRFPTL